METLIERLNQEVAELNKKTPKTYTQEEYDEAKLKSYKKGWDDSKDYHKD